MIQELPPPTDGSIPALVKDPEAKRRNKVMTLPTRRSLLTAATVLPASSGGQTAQAQPTSTPVLDAAAHAEVLNAVLEKMRSDYVFPDIVPFVEAALADPARTQALAAQTTPVAFARALTEMLQTVARDKHLSVRASSEVTSGDGARAMREGSSGVDRVERLPGNIGYVELRGFMPVSRAGDAIAAAMTLVKNTEALIVDVRRNRGGDPNAVALLCSYLLVPRVHLNDLVWRDGTRDVFSTLESIPGPSYGTTRPVYVLTSSMTFSGAEEFSYNMRNLNRATLVGETTGGGANPGDVHRINDQFSMFVPRPRGQPHDWHQLGRHGCRTASRGPRCGRFACCATAGAEGTGAWCC
jgi:hypothetical protein